MPVLVRAELTSDEPEFYDYMQNLSGAISASAQKSGVLISWDSVCNFVLVTHKDGTADLYIQHIPMSAEILAKRDFKAGEMVFQSGVADVRRIQIPGLEVKPDDGVIVCFKVGWKFALFFDLATDRHLDSGGVERSLGRLYRLLSFQDLYEALSDQKLFDQLVESGWFPFVEISGGEFQKLLKAYRVDFDIDAEKQRLIDKFDAARIDAIADRWRNRPSLTGRTKILNSALESFKRNDSVACLKTLLTEMEGIIQEVRIAETGTGTSIKKLLEYAAEKGVKKTGDKESLLFPKQFLHYLSSYTYAQFDPKNPDTGVFSRHSVGHGGAKPDAYTQERALQAILTVDQLSFYL